MRESDVGSMIIHGKDGNVGGEGLKMTENEKCLRRKVLSRIGKDGKQGIGGGCHQERPDLNELPWLPPTNKLTNLKRRRCP